MGNGVRNVRRRDEPDSAPTRIVDAGMVAMRDAAAAEGRELAYVIAIVALDEELPEGEANSATGTWGLATPQDVGFELLTHASAAFETAGMTTHVIGPMLSREDRENGGDEEIVI